MNLSQLSFVHTINNFGAYYAASFTALSADSSITLALFVTLYTIMFAKLFFKRMVVKSMAPLIRIHRFAQTTRPTASNIVWRSAARCSA